MNRSPQRLPTQNTLKTANIQTGLLISVQTALPLTMMYAKDREARPRKTEQEWISVAGPFLRVTTRVGRTALRSARSAAMSTAALGTVATEMIIIAIRPTIHLRFCRLEHSQSVLTRVMDLMTITWRMTSYEAQKEPPMITFDIPGIRAQQGTPHRKLAKMAAARPLDRSRRKATPGLPFRRFLSTTPILPVRGRKCQRLRRIRNHENHDHGISAVPLMYDLTGEPWVFGSWHPENNYIINTSPTGILVSHHQNRSRVALA
jgi:hypothetical protein